MEDLGPVDMEVVIKNKHQMVHVPHWFSVDLKIGVSTSREAFIYLLFLVVKPMTLRKSNIMSVGRIPVMTLVSLSKMLYYNLRG